MYDVFCHLLSFQARNLSTRFQDHEAEFHDALFQDSGKLKIEAQLFELILVKNEVGCC